MRPIAVILIVVAIAASGLAAFLLKRWMVTSEHQDLGPPAMEVLVAAHDIPPGTALQPGDFRWDKWAPSAANPRLITREPNQPDVSGRFIGAIARYALTDGEPIAENSVVRSDTSGVLAAMLAPGMRAISIPISINSAVSGFILPGDHVDVLLGEDVAKETGKKPEGTPIVQYATETILEDMRVIAIDNNLARIAPGKEGGGPAMQGKTATLEVTPKQAELLTLAQMMGPLSLVLRSTAQASAQPDGKVQPPKDPFTADTEVSRILEALHGGGFSSLGDDSHKQGQAQNRGPAVRVNRGGAVSTTSF